MLRRGDNAALQVCAVRRAIVVSGTLFLGVQLIGARPTTAMLALPEPGNVVRSGHRLNRVIFLPTLPRCAGAPGLLTKPNDLPADVTFAVPRAGRMVTMRAGAMVERLGSCELFVLEAVAAQRPADDQPQVVRAA
jgi:hypothetical protein